MSQNMDAVLSTRISKEIMDNIKELASERNRKIGDIIREAIDMYLAEWAEYKIAIDRLKDHNDKILSEEEFRDELDWDL